MVKVKFTVACTAVYQSELEIPKEIENDKKAILEYIHSHLDECNVEKLEWLNDLEPEDAVTMEDIRYVEQSLNNDSNRTGKKVYFGIINRRVALVACDCCDSHMPCFESNRSFDYLVVIIVMQLKCGGAQLNYQEETCKNQA